MVSKARHAAGIYSIRLRRSNTAYIGSSQDISVRWSQHKAALRKGTHTSPYLQNSWSKYGEDNFIFTILEKCPKDLLIEREQYWMDQTKDKFNCAPAAGSRRGVPQPPEAVEKIRVANLGRKCTEEQKQRMSDAIKANFAENPESHHNTAKTHCIRSHELSSDNVYIRKNGTRLCLACKRMKENQAYVAGGRRKPKKTGPPQYANSLKTHCSRGHPLFGDNLYKYRGSRSCKICRNESLRRSRAGKKNTLQ